MHPIFRNILAVLIGAFIGGFVNMQIIGISGSVIPLPEGTNPNDLGSIIQNMPRYEAKHFIMPFLAHALGTFVGAAIAVLIAVSHKKQFALGIGILFLMGGIMMVAQLPSPMWFNILDLTVAYIPMSLLAWKLFSKE